MPRIVRPGVGPGVQFRERDGGNRRFVWQARGIDAIVIDQHGCIQKSAGHGSETRIDDCIEIRTQARVVHAGSATRSFCNGLARHESARWQRPDFGDRGAIARYHQGLPGLHFTQDGCGVVAKFSLGDHAGHVTIVANVALLLRGT